MYQFFLGSGRVWSGLVGSGRVWSGLVGTPPPGEEIVLVGSGRVWSGLVGSGRVWSLEVLDPEEERKVKDRTEVGENAGGRSGNATGEGGVQACAYQCGGIQIKRKPTHVIQA